MTKSKKGNWGRVLVMLLGVFLGGLWGFFGPPPRPGWISRFISPQGVFFVEAGVIYLRLLTVGVLPIIVSAIGNGVGDLLLNHRQMVERSAKRLMLVLLISGILLCCFGIIGWWGIEIAEEELGISRQSLGILAQKDVPIEEVSFTGSADGFATEEIQRARDYVPQNPVEALANSYEIQLVIFALLLGVTVGLFPTDRDQRKVATAALRALQIIFDVFMALTKGLLKGLPLALFFWIAVLIAKRKDDLANILQSMGAFLATFYLVGVLIVLFCSLLIWFLSARRKDDGFLATLDPALTAFFTMNSLAAMPVAINKLREMGYEEQASKQYMSLFLPLLRFGNALYFSVAVFFFAAVYGQNFTLAEAGIVTLYSILVSFSTIGTTSVLAIYPVVLIFEKFGIPAGASVTLLLAVDALVDPMRTTLIVQGNAALTAVMSRREKSR